jgi:predicted nucleotidyltransferase
MRDQHRRVVDRLIDTFQTNPDYLALIVGGSIVRGWERADSDVDIMLVATDQAYERFKAAKSFHYFNRDLCDYEGGYVDGKIVDLQFHAGSCRATASNRRALLLSMPSSLIRTYPV